MKTRAFKKKSRRNKTRRKTIKYKKHSLRGGNNIKQVVSQNIQSRSSNLLKMLQIVCKNPGNCLALGPYDEKIKLFFDNFRNLNYIDNLNVKTLSGGDSSNGYVIEVPFKKDNYTAYTVLKMSQNAKADNLYYEYYVGKYFINKYIKKLPCFIETYDLYEFNSEKSYNLMDHASFYHNFSNVDIKSHITRVETEGKNLFNYSCVKNKMLCILIQHFDKFVSLNMERKSNYQNIIYDLYNIAFQVYYALCQLGESYTHNDLHWDNVMLYKPFEGETCVLMRYHQNDNIINEFKSEYIIKIIDYGRNFFNNGNTSTNKIMLNICNTPDCAPNCGEKVGYESINIYSNPDMGADLMFNIDAENFYKLFRDKNGNSINFKTIFDVFNYLNKIIVEFNSQNNWKKYENWKVAATMDIYDDGRDYDFVILPDYNSNTNRKRKFE